MATLYQRNMNQLNPTQIQNIYDTVNYYWIPIAEQSPFYQKVLQYLADNNLTIDQLDVYGS